MPSHTDRGRLLGWDFDEIAELHARKPGQAKSSIERLLEVGAASPDVLCELADALEARGGAYVGALFQLPFEVAVEGDWQALPTSRDSLSADVRLRAMRLHLDDFGRFSLQAATEPDRQLEPGSHLITQGMAVFQVWGSRRLSDLGTMRRRISHLLRINVLSGANVVSDSAKVSPDETLPHTVPAGALQRRARQLGARRRVPWPTLRSKCP